MIRVVIVDDHELIREGVKKIIRSSTGMQVVGEAGAFSAAVLEIERTKPDLVVLDISLPDRSGIQGITDMRQQFPSLPVLVLSMYPEERYALRAIKAGAAGFITKTMAAEELVRAIGKVMEGGNYISASVAELLARSVRQSRPWPGPEHLTPRELQVTTLLGAGKTPKQVAAELGISISSVNTYRARIFEKLEIGNDRQLIRFALENGLAE